MMSLTISLFLTGIEASKILELFGEWFLDFCQESGYDRILQVLGGTLRDFISNLDALHDHLASAYPGMHAPSFRVSDRADGTLILHYYSSREGLEYIVIGLIRAVARKLLNTEISVEIIKRKQGQGMMFNSQSEKFVVKRIPTIVILNKRLLFALLKNFTHCRLNRKFPLQRFANCSHFI